MHEYIRWYISACLPVVLLLLLVIVDKDKELCIMHCEPIRAHEPHLGARQYTVWSCRQTLWANLPSPPPPLLRLAFIIISTKWNGCGGRRQP